MGRKKSAPIKARSHDARPRSVAVPPGRAARAFERGVLLLAAVAAVYAHGLFLRHAGPLWRDEINTAVFAAMPSLKAIGAMLRYDSVPLASTLILRTWMHLGFRSDAALRALGLIVGVATLAALWWSARRHRAALPVCTLLLFSLNSWVIRGGDAIRPLGLGMLFVVLAFVTLGRALENPRPARIAMATLAAVLAVQSIYSNVPLIAGVCLGGIAWGLVSRSAIRSMIAAGVGAVAALSLLPYLPAIRAARDWGILVRAHAVLGRLWEALRSETSWDGPAWVILVALGLGAAVVRLARPTRGSPPGPELDLDRARTLYAAVTLIAGALAFVALIVKSELPTQAWYYLPLLAIGAATLDALLAPLARGPGATVVLGIVAGLAIVVHVVAIAPSLRVRQTNIDLVAAKIRAEATPRDVIVVSPWYLGVAFHRYYSGPVTWFTTPPLEDLSIHRYDLLKRRMQEPASMDTVVHAISRTLASGGRVWLVGEVAGVEAGTTPEPPPAGPWPGKGWWVGGYIQRWGQLVYATLRDHATSSEEVPVPVKDPVFPYESARLFVLQGWH